MNGSIQALVDRLDRAKMHRLNLSSRFMFPQKK